MALRNPAITPFDQINTLGVAIKYYGDEQYHVGLLYKLSPDAEIRLFHFRGHESLQDCEPNPTYFWDAVGLDDDNSRVLLAKILRVRDRRNVIPYGFVINGLAFDADGNYAGGSNEGLTCATFIVQLFKSYAHEFIDENSWEFRVADMQWQQEYAALHDEDRCTGLLGQIGHAARVRPTEVVAAVSTESTQWPMTFEAVEPLAKIVAREVAAMGL